MEDQSLGGRLHNQPPQQPRKDPTPAIPAPTQGVSSLSTGKPIDQHQSAAPTPQSYIDNQKITEIKRFRRDIDSFLKAPDKLQKSREVSLFATSLQRGFMWLEESLKELGSHSPYVSSEDPTNKTIEPTADHTDETDLPAEFFKFDHLEKVKFLRNMLSFYLKDFKEFAKKVLGNEDFLLCLTESRKAMMEAKMWLGWELARIRDAK